MTCTSAVISFKRQNYVAVTLEMARCLPISLVMANSNPDFFSFVRLPTEIKWLVLRNLDTSELLIVALVSDEWKGLAKKIIEGRKKNISLSSIVQKWPNVTGEYMTGEQIQEILRSLSQLKLDLCLTVDDHVETQELLQEAGPELFCAAVSGMKSAEVRFLETEELLEGLFSTVIVADSNLEVLTIEDYSCNLEQMITELVEPEGVWININYEENSDPVLKRCTVICSWRRKPSDAIL